MSFNDVIKAVYNDVSDSSLFSNRYVQLMIISVVIGLASASAYVGYSKYRIYKNQEAQKILSVCLEEYARAMNGSIESWPTVEMSSQLGYEQHKNADIAPYFLALQVEALLHQGKKDEVQPLLDAMLQRISSASPLYHFYKTQKALIQMDADDAHIAKQGLDELRVMAQDNKNANRDVALYYVGLYYWTHNQIADAQAEWKELAAQYPTSPWTHVVSVQLQQMA